MTSTIFTSTNMIVFFSGVGAWRLPSASSENADPFLEEDPVTHFAVLSNSQKTSLCLKKPSDIWSALFWCRNTHTFCWLLEASENLNTQTKVTVSRRQLATSLRI